MSTRKGTIVRLDDILNEAKVRNSELDDLLTVLGKTRMRVVMETAHKTKALENSEKVAEVMALAAIVIQDHQSRRLTVAVLAFNHV